MTDKPTGGSAFPVSTNDGETAWGMTLRDWFAGRAMLLARDELDKDVKQLSLRGIIPYQKSQEDRANDIAAIVYIIADAMLAERAK
jgi:hypothetical protein